MIDFRKSQVLIFGLGLHGGAVAAAKWLLKHGAHLIVVDKKSRAQLKTSLDRFTSGEQRRMKCYFSTDPDERFLSVDLILQNPGVPREHPFLKRAARAGIPVYNEAGLFFQLVKNPIVGITGSKGKSTTTDLLGSVLRTKFKQRVQVGGNIRTVPMFRLIERIQRNSLPVLELSSWHLEGLPLIGRSPHIAVITNVLPEHLNRYRHMADYAAAKRIILDYQGPGDRAVLNFDNEWCRRFARSGRGRKYWFSVQKKVPRGCFVRQGEIYWRDDGKESRIMPVSELPLRGQHNLANVLAVVTAARLLKVSRGDIRTAIAAYQGLPDRLQLIRTRQDVEFYNDTTATAPAAAVAALRTFPAGRVILIAGGSSKRLPVGELARTIKSQAKQCLLFTGEGSVELDRELKRIGFPQSRLQTGFTTMPKIVRAATRVAAAGDVVLLAPGFASFSNFVNEFERGEQFNNAVKNL